MTNNIGPDPQDENSPLYTVVDTQPSSPSPATPDSSQSSFTLAQRIPTAITAAQPPVVTCASHGWSNGNAIRATQFISWPLASATGMEQLNTHLFYVQNATTDTFELYDSRGYPIDGRNYTTYVSGGQFTLSGNTPLVVNPSSFPPLGYPPFPPA